MSAVCFVLVVKSWPMTTIELSRDRLLCYPFASTAQNDDVHVSRFHQEA